MSRLIVQGEAIYWDRDKDSGDLYSYYRHHIAAGQIAVEVAPEEEYLTDKQLVTNLQVDNAALRARISELERALRLCATRFESIATGHVARDTVKAWALVTEEMVK